MIDPGRTRNFSLILVAFATYLSRLGRLGIIIFTIPITYNYLGPERFGAWMTISSFSGLLAFADLGFGNGLINVIATANAKADTDGVKRAISSAYVSMAGIVLVVSFLLIAWWQYGNLPLLFEDSVHGKELVAALAVFLCFFVLNLMGNLIQKIQLGLQEGYWHGIWLAISAVTSIASVPIAVAHEASLPVLVLCLYGSEVLGGIINTILWFSRHSAFSPRWRFVSRESVALIGRIGFLFFVIQIAAGLAFQSDNYLIATQLGTESVADYAIVQKVFSIVAIGVATALSGMWPAYADAIGRKDMDWVRNAFRLTIIWCLLTGGVACVLVAIFFDHITQFWLHRTLESSHQVVIAFAIWTVLDIVGAALGSLLNGATVIRFQVVCASLMAVAAVALKLILVNSFGAVGAVMGTILAYSFISVPLTYWYVSKKLFSSRISTNV